MAITVIAGLLLLVGVISGFVFGIPALVSSVNTNQISEALPEIASNFDTATAELPRDTLVSGSFTDKGEVMLTNVATESVSTATLSVSDRGYLVTFEGTLNAYTITLTAEDVVSQNVIYDSTTETVRLASKE